MRYDTRSIGLEATKQSGDEAMVLCPYHDDRHASASFNVKSGLFFCFTCGTSKNAQQLAADLDGEVVDIAMRSDSITIPSLGDEYEDWSKFLGFKLAIDNLYLKSRMVTNHQVKVHQIMDYNGQGIIIPMTNRIREATGVVIRQLHRTPKYLILGKRPPVWPMDLVPTMVKEEKIFLVEGIFGVLRAEKFGQSAIATLGTGGLNKALKFINSNPGIFNGRLVGLMDTDLPGKVAAAKLIANKIPVVHLHKKDPDEWGSDTWSSFFSRFGELTCDSINELARTIAAPDRNKFFESINKWG